MGWPANIDGTFPPYPRDTVAGLEPVQINVNQFAGDPTTDAQLAVNLPATSTLAGITSTPEELSLEYFGNTGTSEILNFTFTPNTVVGNGSTVNPDNTITAGTGVGQSNIWTMVIRDAANNNDIVGNYTLQFDDTRNSGGSLAVVAEGLLQDGVTPSAAYDEVTGEFSVTTSSGPISINIGAIGANDGLTQLSDNFAPVQINKNGSPVGNLTSVDVDANGLVSAIYDIGFTRTIYQIPVVDVPNPNGLIALSDQTYQASPESGSFFLWDAGDGPWGEVISYAREESATDVAGELTALITTQRAYSSNAKVIQTVDEMLQETTNIIR
jgi:flagellar hook protein FlgE